ncbi:MAG: hypothetical protein CSA26_01360 [Desulfobacterales bacterium]|nr:MAG: hypothetical protein CSA26_01360 [Desulfobacterales bacterium]
MNILAIKDAFLQKTWSDRAYMVMYAGLCIYILCMPLGRAFRETGTVLAACGLLCYYLLDYRHSRFAQFPLKWFFGAFWLYMFIKVFHSINVHESWYIFEHGLRKGVLFFFVGMECVRSIQDLKRFTILFCIMGCYEGLDGIYQYATGYDLLRGTALFYERLTGSFSTPRVGDLMAVTLPVVTGSFFLWMPARKKQTRSLFTLLILFPALFLLVGAQSRSAYIGFSCASISMLWFFRGLTWKHIGIIILLLLGVLFGGLERVSMDNALTDSRLLHLWPAAISVFKEMPLLGIGVGGFHEGVQSLGISLPPPWDSIVHPHNIYLQLACETGIVGLGLFGVWIGSSLWWSWKKIRFGWLQGATPSAWGMAFCFWSSYVGYLATAFSAHDFFRPWWLGLSLAILGITLGACMPLASETSSKASFP